MQDDRNAMPHYVVATRFRACLPGIVCGFVIHDLRVLVRGVAFSGTSLHSHAAHATLVAVQGVLFLRVLRSHRPYAGPALALSVRGVCLLVQ